MAKQIVRRLENRQKTQAVEVLIDGGPHRFAVLQWFEPDANNPYETSGYWTPVYLSGLYASADDAQAAAAAELDWVDPPSLA
jgi:hypothetical protein